jgi:hypothetical protein
MLAAMAESREEARAEEASDVAEEGRQCDFCGARVPRVRRVALDRDYERLQTPHPVRYACPDCSAEKERVRDGAS